MSENNGICKYLPHELLDDPEFLDILNLKKLTGPGEIPITGDWHKTCKMTNSKSPKNFCPYTREILLYKDERRFGVPVVCVEEMKKECGDYSPLTE